MRLTAEGAPDASMVESLTADGGHLSESGHAALEMPDAPVATAVLPTAPGASNGAPTEQEKKKNRKDKGGKVKGKDEESDKPAPVKVMPQTPRDKVEVWCDRLLKDAGLARDCALKLIGSPCSAELVQELETCATKMQGLFKEFNALKMDDGELQKEAVEDLAKRATAMVNEWTKHHKFATGVLKSVEPKKRKGAGSEPLQQSSTNVS